MIYTFCVIAFTLVMQRGVSGESCTYANNEEGYCREKEFCPNIKDNGSCESGFVCCPISKKSIEKCKEYGKYVYKEEYAAALTVRSLIHNSSECSIEAVPLVVGGIKAKVKELPHMVAIGFGDTIDTAKWMCGGSLISKEFVLTAAHCSQSRERGPAKFARLGSLNVNSVNDPNAQDFNIIERIVHPKYKVPSRYHDIALFKLSPSVKMDGYSRPACLQVTPNEFSFKRAVASGWGKQEYNAKEGSPELMKVALDLIDYDTCNSSFSADIGGRSLPSGIISSQFCAGELKGGKDTCQGDSGGPLQVVKESPYCMYSIIGITSFGKFCGFKNSPAVYTKVSYYIPWIESIVWP